MSNDLARLFSAQAEVRRWTAERENATARLELARDGEAMAHLISQHEPLASLNVDRDALRLLLAYVKHHDMSRLLREMENAK